MLGATAVCDKQARQHLKKKGPIARLLRARSARPTYVLVRYSWRTGAVVLPLCGLTCHYGSQMHFPTRPAATTSSLHVVPSVGPQARVWCHTLACKGCWCIVH